jgi:hypothetical protein
LRISSLQDGEVQELDRFTARMWSNASAYFNGDTLLVEIVAAPRTRGNRVRMASVGVELIALVNCPGHACTCTPDTRFPSNEDWSARWVSGGCSASVYNQNGCYVSAGHCYTDAFTVLGFRIPLSLNNCAMQQPPVADQFPVLMTASDGTPCAPDWRVGKLGVNSINQTHFQRYGVFKPLASAPPPVTGAIDIYAFGSSVTPVVNGVQQHTSGMSVVSVSGNSFNYTGTGTITGGTSGGGVIYNNAIVGVNTCCYGPCTGIASRIDQPAFVTARQQMCPHTVHAPWDTPFCLNDTQQTVGITICNTSASTETYQLNFAPVSPGPMCAVPGPTGFTVIGSNPTGPVLPGQCITVSVIIARPPGLTAAWLTSCYDVTVTAVSTSLSVTERGSVQDRRDMCTGAIGVPNDVATFALNTARRLTFSVRDTSGLPAGVAIPYRVEAFAPDMEPSGAISLNGQYEGVPATGVFFFPQPGATAEIGVDVRYRWLQQFDISDLVVSTDVDGDGVFEPLMSVGARSVVTLCPADFNGSGEVSVQDIFDFLSAWNAQVGQPGGTADFNGSDGVTVQDIFDYFAAWNAGCP